VFDAGLFRPDLACDPRVSLEGGIARLLSQFGGT